MTLEPIGDSHTPDTYDPDRAVSATLRERLVRAIPPNTRRAYARIWDGSPHADCARPDCEHPKEWHRRGFVGWCEHVGRTPMPATPETLAEYVSYLCDRDLSPATIEQAIAAIRTRHRLANYGKHFPDSEAALLALKDHRRTRAVNGKGGQRQARPIDVKGLHAMVATIDQDTAVGVRDHALLLYGICLFGRRSELADLRWSDLAGAAEGMTVRIRMSKTDQDAKGVSIPVLWGSTPDTNPILVTERWRQVCGVREGDTSHLLRAVDQYGHPRRSLAPAAINTIVQNRARLAGLGPGYSAHSLRAGAATIAYGNGAPISMICRLGRWEQNSPVVLGYIRAVDDWKNHPFRGAM